MFLGPHHFQQWDRYYEGVLNLRLKSVMSLYWGLEDLEVDKEGLENSSFTLLACHGILPGGIFVDVPETDDPPPSRTIEEHFDPSMETLGVYLAIPTDRPGSVNCRLEGSEESSDTRYFRDFIQTVDENTGNNEQEIPIAKKSLKILFADESLDAHDFLKIAELERTPNGNIALKGDFVPTCVSISGSQRIQRMVRRLTELLTAKSDELREQFREKGDGSYEFGASDVSNLWLFQIINSYIPELNHFYSTGRGHPEDLFRTLAQFAGAMTVFSTQIRPVNLPVYDHEDLTRAFGGIDTAIQELLQGLSPTATKYTMLPLREARESIYEASVADYLFSPSYKFYVAIRGGSGGGDLITEIPRRVKVASGNEIDFLIGKALRGIGLNYSPSPPAAIPRKAGYFYFNLDPGSDFWGDAQQTKSVAIYVPTSFEGVELELMAVEE